MWQILQEVMQEVFMHSQKDELIPLFVIFNLVDTQNLDQEYLV